MIRLLILSLLLASAALAQITPSTLPNGYVGSTFGASPTATPNRVAEFDPIVFSVSEGSGEYSFEVIEGELPSGMFLDSTGGLLGAPESAGTYNFTIEAMNEVEDSELLQTSIVVLPPLTFTASATVGASFDLPLTCPGEDFFFAFGLAGDLPSGLSFNSETGAISGEPLGPAGSFPTTWTCEGEILDFQAALTITVLPGEELTISPPTLPNAYLGSSYAATVAAPPIIAALDFVQLEVTGIDSIFDFQLTSGALPPGLTLSSFGTIEGVPSAVGAYSFTVMASGAETTVSRAYTLRVLPPFAFNYSAVLGSTFRQPMECPEADAVYHYSAGNGLPSGLTVNPETGWITGVPTGPVGQSTFEWFCDGGFVAFRAAVTISVRDLPVLSFNAELGADFIQDLAFGESTGTFEFRVASGQLPPGLSLNPTLGQVSGTPSRAGTFTFVVEKVGTIEDEEEDEPIVDSRKPAPHTAVEQSSGRVAIYQTRVQIIVAQGLSISMTPTTLALEAVADGPVVLDSAVVRSSRMGDSYSLVTRTNRGGRWLTATPVQGATPRVLEIQADPLGLAPGQYVGFVEARSANATASTGTAELQVTMTVLPAAPDALSVSPSGIQASFRQGAAPSVRQIQVGNRGSGPILFEARAATANGGNWLSVNPASGSASGRTPAVLRVTIDPTGLRPGAYKGTIAINAPAAGGSVEVPVTVTVTGDEALLRLSQTGVSFRVEQGANPPAASFFIQEALGRLIDWQASAATTSDGAWLAVSPSSGSTGPQSSANVIVSSSRLAPGRYFGRVAVTSLQAANSPQTATVLLKVEPQGTLLSPTLSAKGLAFAASPMTSTQLTRGIFVGNPTARAQTLEVSTSFPGSPVFFTSAVENPRLPPGGNTTLTVRLNAAQLAAGVYRGFIDLAFAAGGPTARLEVMLVVAEGAIGGPAFLTEEGTAQPSQSACTPSTLHLVVLEPGDNFIVEQGQPVHIEAFVIDNCGRVPTDAVVWALFSNGDEPVALTRNSRGGYSGVWTPLRAGTLTSALKAERTFVAQQNPSEDHDDAQITIQANQLNTAGGSTQVGGSLSATAGIPVISPGGAVSAASFAAHNPVSPGAFISIFGGNLAPGVGVATSLPLPLELNNVSVTAAGQPVALNYVSPTQINGVLPFGLTIDTAQQIVVKNGNALSTPESVSVSAAQPAVFTQSLSGVGPGIVVGVRPDGSQYLVGPDNRLRVGDAAVIYCAGLGSVDQDVDASEAAPTEPLARTLKDVTVTIGGVAAEVFYAGLAPGFAGLYQVNAIVATGTPSGASVPLVLSVDEIQNPVVTVAVQ